jgi:hypothetical protein
MSGASEAHRGIKGMLDRYFGRPAVSSGRIFEEREALEMGEAPSPRHGSADARIYAFAKLMFDEVGPDEASRLADRYVAFTQQLIRPWPHED